MTQQIRHNIRIHKLGSSFKELILIKIQKKDMQNKKNH